MSEPLVFMMGKFAAEFPTDRQYAKNHMWGQPRDGGWSGSASRPTPCGCCKTCTFWTGRSTRARRCAEKQEIGAHRKQEGRKQPVRPDGRHAGASSTSELLSDPSAINVDKYGGGWLFEIEGRRRRAAGRRTSTSSTWPASGK